MDSNQSIQAGEIIYVIIRNPHAQDVANIQQAAVVHNPEEPGQLALFLHETYYPLSDEFAVFQSEAEAEQAYREAFGISEEGDFFG